MAEVKDVAAATNNNVRAMEPKAAPGLSSAVPRSPVIEAAGERQTVIEDGTLFKGSLSSTCAIVVKGRIEGDVNAPSLTVSNSGAVHGKVKVAQLRSQGEIAGHFDAESVQLSGSVKDKTVVRAQSLEVRLAPKSGKIEVVFGECELEVGGARASAPPPAEERSDTDK